MAPSGESKKTRFLLWNQKNEFRKPSFSWLAGRHIVVSRKDLFDVSAVGSAAKRIRGDVTNSPFTDASRLRDFPSRLAADQMHNMLPAVRADRVWLLSYDLSITAANDYIRQPAQTSSAQHLTLKFP